MLGAIGHTVPILTALDYCSHGCGCAFAPKSRPFLGTQRVLFGQATGDEPLRPNGLFGASRAGVVLEEPHISPERSTSGSQRRYALELKCSAAAESLCGLVIRASCGQLCSLVMMPASLGATAMS